MADARTARRAGPLSTRPPVSVALVPPMTRFNFRGSAAAAALCGAAFGCSLPGVQCRADREGDRAALSLGPDEWLLLAEADGGDALHGVVEQALGAVPHSLVDISHRQAGFEVAGEGAAALLNAGCPLDLGPAAFPVGMATRTVLAKADVTLWHWMDDRFFLDVARSFAPYVLDFLRAAEAGL